MGLEERWTAQFEFFDAKISAIFKFEMVIFLFNNDKIKINLFTFIMQVPGLWTIHLKMFVIFYLNDLTNYFPSNSHAIYITFTHQLNIVLGLHQEW